MGNAVKVKLGKSKGNWYRGHGSRRGVVLDEAGSRAEVGGTFMTDRPERRAEERERAKAARKRRNAAS